MDNVMFKEKKNIKHEGKEVVGNKLVSAVLGVIFFALSAFLVFNSVRSFQIANDKLKILEKARKDVTDFRLKSIKLILEKGRIETDDYTETDIRNRLNYSKKNEVIFVLSDAAIDTALVRVNDLLKEDVVKAQEKTNFQIWISFLNGGI